MIKLSCAIVLYIVVFPFTLYALFLGRQQRWRISSPVSTPTTGPCWWTPPDSGSTTDTWPTCSLSTGVSNASEYQTGDYYCFINVIHNKSFVLKL